MDETRIALFAPDTGHARVFAGSHSQEIRRQCDGTINLAADGSLETLKQQLRSEVEARLRKDGDPRMFGRGEIFESYQYVGGHGRSYDAWLKYHK